MATQRALAIPEIVYNIVDQLSATSFYSTIETDLLNCALVNKTWMEAGLDRLWDCTWHHARRLGRLLKIAPHRRQYYARWCRFLLVNFDGGQFTDEEIIALSSLEYPRLHSFSGQFGMERNIELSLAFVKPSLRNIWLSINYVEDGTTAAQLLPNFKKSAPNLQKFVIGNPSQDIDPEALLEFFKSMPTLRGIGLSRYSISRPIYEHLVGRPNLELLVADFADGWTRHALPVRPGFLYLNSLTVECGPQFAASLCRHLSLLETIYLTLAATEDDTNADYANILSSIAKCSKLTLVDLKYQESAGPTGDSLIALGKGCPKLEDLTLQATNTWAVEPPAPRMWDIGDCHIETFAVYVPGLRSFSFDAQWRHGFYSRAETLSYKSFMALGRNCRSLNSCEINAEFDLLALEDELTCLFPELRILEFTIGGQTLGLRNESDENLAPGLRKLLSIFSLHCPEVFRFRNYYHPDLGLVTRDHPFEEPFTIRSFEHFVRGMVPP